MARRSRKSGKLPIFIAAATLIALFTLVFLFFGKTSSEPFRTIDNLDVDAYMQNSGSLRGNVYRLEAEVVHALAFSPKEGRLISVSPKENQILPVLIPQNFSSINIQKGQRFVFLLEVDDRGILVVRELTKA